MLARLWSNEAKKVALTGFFRLAWMFTVQNLVESARVEPGT